MTKKTRKSILFFLIIGFLLAAVGFILYSLGWSLNQTVDGFLTFKKTGAVFLKTQPNNVSIRINGKSYPKKTGLFNNDGRLIKGFLAGDYQVEISKEGFGSWQKNLTVEAGLVSSASKIFLFPQKIPIELITQKDAEKFWLTDNKKEEIKNLFYSLKQKQLKMPGRVPIVQIETFPFDTEKAIIASQKAIYLLDRQNFTLELLVLVSINALTTNGSEIIFVDQKNNLQIYETKPHKITITEKIALGSSEKIIKTAVSKSNNKIALLTEKEELFIYERQKKELKLISGKIKDFRFSPDSKKLAVLIQTGEINVIFLEDYHRDFRMAAGESLKLELLKNIPALDFDWLPQILDYLVIQYPEEIIVAEIDSRPPTNWWLLAENIQDFAFDKENNLYFLRDAQFLKVVL